ncbi:MAG: hypothetical protein ACR2M4_02380 [Actinomycetota bacterium]
MDPTQPAPANPVSTEGGQPKSTEPVLTGTQQEFMDQLLRVARSNEADSHELLSQKLTAELGRIAAKEKAQGKWSARKEIEEQLGLSFEDADKLIKEARAAQDAEKSEAQKAKEEADREKALAVKEKADAAAERHSIKVERALMIAGVNPVKVAHIARLVDAEPGADDDAIKAAIEAVKTSIPELFAAPANDHRPTPVSGDPLGTPPRNKPSEDAYSKGQDLAKKFNERRGVKVS